MPQTDFREHGRERSPTDNQALGSGVDYAGDAAEQSSQQNAELLRAQNQALERVVQGAPLADTLDRLLRVIEAQCPGMLASILMLDGEGTRVRHVASPSLPGSFTGALDGQSIGPRAGSCGTAAFRREPVIVEDIAADPLWEPYRAVARAHDLAACWSTPIFDAERRVLGTFALYFREPGRPTPFHWQLIDLSTHVAAVAIVHDRESRELRRRETQLAEAQQIAHVGSYEWDVGENRVDRSEELCRIFGVDPDTFPPTFEGYLERVHPDDRRTTRTIIEQAVRDARPFDFEERIVRPDGEIRRLRSQGRWNLDSSGRPIRLMGICQDITERKLAEDQLRKTVELQARNEELKAFAYTVSHDLKAPLRGIAGYAQEIDRRHRSGLDERGLWCLAQIMTATANLDRLIEDLLHYSRVDAQTPTPTEIDLAAMVETILHDCKPLIAAHGTQVTVELSARRVSAWQRGLTQALTNLIDNAIKYSRDAVPPTVRIGSDVLPGRVRVTVADNGIGFDMKHRDRIFGLFNRLVRQEDFEGTGAGLAIVKKVVEKMGGSVRAESSPGAGSTFIVELPQPAPAQA
jgi:PAS domain S-box-containing protein